MGTIPRLRLAPFDPAFAATVLSWARDEQELERWASLGTDRATPAVFAEWHRDPDVHPFLLDAGEAPIGYGEVWADPVEDEAELARLLVAPAARGRGAGRALLGLLAGVAHELGFDAVWLRVLPENAPALACYRAAGFIRAGAELERAWNAGQPADYVWMHAPPPP